MYGATTGFLHALAVLRADGIDADAFTPYATQFAAGLPAMLTGIAAQVQSGTYGPGEAHLDMQAAYLEHLVQVSDARGVDPGFPRYIQSVVARAVADGHGGDDIGRLVEHLTTSPTEGAPSAA
jgi:3-hydroxyisobutyrate dehydrogenase-like beta-hydroxyacid dehydrogenase